MISVVIFTSKLFLPSLTHTSLSHTHCLCQAFTAPTHTPSQTERSTPTHHDRDLAGHRNCADRADRDRVDRDLVIDASRDRNLVIDASRDRDLADRHRSRSSKSARLRSRSRSARLRSRSHRSRSRRSRSHREIDLSFWVLFEFLGMNDIMCLFGS